MPALAAEAMQLRGVSMIKSWEEFGETYERSLIGSMNSCAAAAAQPTTVGARAVAHSIRETRSAQALALVASERRFKSRCQMSWK